ncbi:IucA/IucC family protein [Paracoccus aestuarii]|uniref:IucA/IucC family protein n=1 Tax=Paracoccus aestuarii TaxID=453842 RepID=A0A418ZQB6_9RHOB|nr:IucA/IucC family protein [Paracoccus aestuarii]RJK97443.1 IucA/IucC family protein [Paracoccus aestuarii]WCR00934.1 AMP-binding protein [Paracoccus aestuarii]
MSPEERSLRQTVEALAFERILTPVPGGWRVGGLVLRARSSRQVTGRIRLLEVPRMADGRPLTPGALRRGLAEAGLEPAALIRAMRRSAHFLRQAGPVAHDRLRLTGLALEAALIEGHPYHPGFKSRTGFSAADNRAYGPEGEAGVAPVWLRADPGLVHRVGTDPAEGWAAPGAVPVHPWQWARLRDDRAVRDWLDRGRIAVLGQGPAMQATASLRTLAPRAGGDHLKLSLGVGVTSSLRDLPPWSVAVAPAVSDWLARVVAGDPRLAGLRILAEHGAVMVAPGRLGGRLAAIRRAAPPPGAVPLSALSLSGPDGRPLIADWLDRHGTGPWVARLVAVLAPVWHLMTHHGIALEAHGQNLLLVHRDGWPESLVARDFSESLEYVPDRLARPDLAPDLEALWPAMAGAAPGTHHRMARPEDLRDLVMDCLVTHLLSDLAWMLHRDGRLPEGRFWALLRGAWPPAAALATHAPEYPAERLAGRLLGLCEPHPVPNPLREPPMTAHFRLDDQLIDPDRIDLPPLEGDPDRLRVALHLRDPARCLAAILRLRDRGATCHPIHPELPADQARDLARRSGCGLFLDEGGVTALDGDVPCLPGGGLIQTSSGTTGAPRIVIRPWAEVAGEVRAYVAGFARAAGMTPVIAAPITHSYGLIAGVMAGMARGHVPVLIQGANPRRILRQLGAVPRPILYAAPPLLHALARLAGPGGLHAVMSSGTILPQPWFDALRGSARHLFQQYGCSEAGCLSIAEDPRSPEDMGIPLPHLRMTAGQGGATGPVRVILPDGRRIETGDLGRIRDGRLIFAGRAAEVIDVSGLNVYPAQIEAAALSLPGVEDAVAFALPDPSSGERPGLAYAGAVPEDRLAAHLAAHLSARQCPARLFRMPALPRGANGKIARRDLARAVLA